MQNLTAAQTDDRRVALVAARDTLARAIDVAVDRGDGTVAQLVAQYRSTLAEIADIDAGATLPEPTVIDELAGRRQTRTAGAADPVRASRRRKSGDG